MFDTTRAQKAVDFINLLKHTGDYHGIPFNMLEWEHQIVWNVFGSMHPRFQDRRLYRTVYVETPKKNGKSELMGAIACKHLFDKDEPQGEIYGCAGDRDQASIIYHTAVEMIEQEPALEERVKINDSYKLITNRETGTFYRVLSAESFTKHGYRPSIVLFDELHVQPNRDLWDTMTKGAFLARRQPLLWVITTAGSDPDRITIGWEIHEKAQTILQARANGDKENDIPTWYPVIYSYQGEDVFNEKNWHQANPSLGKHLRVEDLRELAAEAKLSPADERTFRWLHLNQWVTTKLTGWLPLDLWDATCVDSDWTRNLLLGKDCYPGLDLSSTIDLSSICYIFPPQDGLDHWHVIWDNFIPEDNMQQRIREDKVPYDRWAAEGWIIPTPGNVIDYTRIENRLIEAANMYNFIEGGADMKFAAMLIQRLTEEHGQIWVDIPQYYAHLTDPMQYIETLLKSGQLQHEDNPVARWAFGNTSISSNGSGYIKYVKETKGKGVIRTKRIDPIAALVIGMARAKFYETGASVYDERGLTIL